MSPFDVLSAGAVTFASDWILLGVLTLAGLIYGAIFGAIPGVSSLVAMLSVLPLAFTMKMEHSLVLLAAIYCGGCFGGAFSSILLNIPGMETAVATTFDGYPMTRRGLGGKALGAAVTSSAMGGFIGALIFVAASPYVADVALAFGYADYFGIIVMGLFVVGCLSGGSLSRGLLSCALGLLVATIGVSPHSEQVRFAFGSGIVASGIKFVAVMIGVFAIGELLFQVSHRLKAKAATSVGEYTGSQFSLLELLRQKLNILRSAILGAVAGFIPGIGATLASFLAYGVAKSASKTPEKFGTGVLEGVVAPEAANNGATGGAMIPLFTLGIPGGAATAVMLAVFQSQGLQPGPLIFFKQLPLVGVIMVSMLLANALIIPVGRYGGRFFARILGINFGYILAAVAMFSFLGAFSIRNLMLDPITVLVGGIIGYYWKAHNFPIAPFILGVVLGPMAEGNFVRAMLVHDMNIIAVFTSPIGLGFMVFGLLFLIGPLMEYLRRRKEPQLQASRPQLGSLCVYCILLGIAAYLYHRTYSWEISAETGTLGAASWPRVILGTVIILCMYFIVGWILKGRQVGVDLRLGEFLAPHGVYTFGPMIMIAAYFLLIPVTGIIPATLLFSVFVLYLMGVRKPHKSIGFSLGLILAVVFIFIGLMHLYLPDGISFFADFSHWLERTLFDIFSP